MDYYQWRENVIGALIILADVKYQRLAWSGSISSSEGTPNEMLMTLHNGAAFPHFFVDCADHLSSEQIDWCQKMSTAVSGYLSLHLAWNGDEDIERTHSDGRWRTIVMLARKTCIALVPGEA